MKKYYLQVYHHALSAFEEDAWVELKSLEIQSDLARQLAELGIVDIQGGCLQECQAARIQKLLRLSGNFGVDLHGAAVILELLERIEMLQDEIDRLKKNMDS